MIEDDINLLLLPLDSAVTKAEALKLILPFSEKHQINRTTDEILVYFTQDGYDKVLGITEYKGFLCFAGYVLDTVFGFHSHELVHKWVLASEKNAILYSNSNTVGSSSVSIYEKGRSIRFISDDETDEHLQDRGEPTRYEVNGVYPLKVLETYLGFPLQELDNQQFDVIWLV